MRTAAILLLAVGGTTAWRELQAQARLRGATGRLRPRPNPRSTGAVRRLVARLCSVLGFMVALSCSPAAAQRPTSPPGPRRRATPEQPWSGTSGYPPPRPLVRTGPRSSHPALQGRPREGRAGPGDPALFPGAPLRGRPRRLYPRGRARRDHDAEGLFLYSPALPRHRPRRAGGKRVAGAPGSAGAPNRHTVRPGESLWSISADALATRDGARIARYWPRLYRANRQTIGSNPHLIHPGQELRIPPENGR